MTRLFRTLLLAQVASIMGTRRMSTAAANLAKHQLRVHSTSNQGVADEQHATLKSAPYAHAVTQWQQLKNTALALVQKYTRYTVLQGPQPAKTEKEVRDEKMRERAYQEGQEAASVGIGSIILTIINIAIILAVASWYRNNKMAKPLDLSQQTEGEDFQFELCGCLEEPEMCFFSCCCLAVRWADTMHSVGLLAFWTAVIVALALAVLRSFSALGAQMLAWVVFAAVFATFRQELRSRLKLKTGTSEMVKDFLTWWCCVPCAAVQEAREIKARGKEDPETSLAAPQEAKMADK